jgi:hypothetical protein
LESLSLWVVLTYWTQMLSFFKLLSNVSSVFSSSHDFHFSSFNFEFVFCFQCSVFTPIQSVSKAKVLNIFILACLWTYLCFLYLCYKFCPFPLPLFNDSYISMWRVPTIKLLAYFSPLSFLKSINFLFSTLSANALNLCFLLRMRQNHTSVFFCLYSVRNKQQD